MGAWGKGPFDNDTAGDFMTDCVITMANQVNRARRSKSETMHEKGRAALATLIALRRAGMTIDIDTLTHGEDLLDVMLADREYISRWRSPAAYRRRLRKDRDEVRKLIKSERARYKRMGWRDFQ